MNTCPDNIAPEQLSAYRSHALTQAETAHLTLHIADCAACQDTLRHYEQFAQALRAQPSPLDGRQLWRSVHPHITNERGSHMPQSRHLWVSTTVITFALLVITLASFLVLNHQPGKTTMVATQTPIVATPTPWVLSRQWRAASTPSNAMNLKFLPTQPLIGYTCDLYPDHSIGFATTQNGGRSWKEISKAGKPGSVFNCTIYVNPSDDQEVVIRGSRANEGDSWSRSFDGGKTWQTLEVPFEASLGYAPAITNVAWIGDTLFMAVNTPNQGYNPPPLPHVLAASVNGAASVWVDQSGVLNNFHFYFIYLMFSAGQRLSIVGSVTPSRNYITLESSDKGNSWRQVSYNSAAGSVLLEGTLNDGKTLIGSYGTDSQPAYSEDDGKNWRVLPPLPSGFTTHYGSILRTPDGSFFTEGSANNNNFHGYFRLLPGSITWTGVMSNDELTYYVPVNISWDQQGNIVALWGISLDASQQGGFYVFGL